MAASAAIEYDKLLGPQDRKAGCGKRCIRLSSIITMKLLVLAWFTLGGEALAALSAQLVSESFCRGAVDEGFVVFCLVLALLTSALASCLHRRRGSLADYLNGVCAALCICLAAFVHRQPEACSRFVRNLGYAGSAVSSLVILLDFLALAEYRGRGVDRTTPLSSNGEHYAAQRGVRRGDQGGGTA